jgi:hypothetical protein
MSCRRATMSSTEDVEQKPAAYDSHTVDLIEVDQHDAELLGRRIFVMLEQKLIEVISEAGIQAGTEAQLLFSGSIWDFLQHHQSLAVDCVHVSLLDSRWSGGNGLGKFWIFNPNRPCLITSSQGWFIPSGFIFLVGIAMVGYI